MEIPEDITAHAQEALKHLVQAKIHLAVSGGAGAEDKQVREMERAEQTIEHYLLDAMERSNFSPVLALARVTANTRRAEVRFTLTQALIALATFDALLGAWAVQQGVWPHPSR